MEHDPQAPGVYVHVPLCKSKCAYCDFYSVTDGDQARYVDAVIKEINLQAEYRAPKCRGGINPRPKYERRRDIAAGDKPLPYNYSDHSEGSGEFDPTFPLRRRGLGGFVEKFDSLYLGGGTPSLLEPDSLARLVEAVRGNFESAEDVEITLEANPDDATEALLRAWRSIGVNRLSLGVQSLFDEDLRFFGRRHSSAQAEKAVNAARKAGFDNIGLDLIYGFWGQSISRWKACLEKALELEPEHLSCYQLTIADDTPLSKEVAAGRLERLSEDSERRFFVLTSEFLQSRGYEHYEISNFALNPSLRSRHNQKYWRRAPYVGLGPAAHSFDGSERWSNVKSLDRYCESLESGLTPIADRERLSEEQLRMEELMLGFRTSDGVAKESLEQLPDWERKLERMVRQGLVAAADGRIRPTLEGFLVADSLPLNLL